MIKIPKPDTIKSIAMIGGLIGVGYAIFKINKAKNKITNAAEIFVTQKINPASKNNVIFQTTQETGKKIGRGLFCLLNDCTSLPKRLRS